MATYGGPFNNVLFIHTDSKGFGWRRNRYRQKAPYLKDLPYDIERHDMYRVPNPWYTSYGQRTTLALKTASAAAHNKAYADFANQARGVTASLGATLGERKQAIDMMASRARQVFNFARHLKSFRFRMALEDLGLQVTKDSNTKRHWRGVVRNKENQSFDLKFKKQANAFGNNFLEVHFGWEPLVKDIYAAVELTTSPIKTGSKNKEIVGKGSVKTTLSPIPSLGLKTFVNVDDILFEKERIRALVGIENPNEFLISQFGLLNPAAVLWELVPFSFVVDWFSSVGQVLQSSTDFCGLSLKDYVTTTFNKKVRRYFERDYPNRVNGTAITAECWRLEVVYVKRTLTMTGPTIALKQVKLPSVTRGLTAVALLTQMLR